MPIVHYVVLLFTLEISPPEHDISSESMHNLSAMSCERIDNVEHISSHILVQSSVRESLSFISFLYKRSYLFLLCLATNICEDRHELAVKKAMKNIMTWKSVVYTKTDFTQICNKSNIRKDAVERLVNSKLLIHGNNFWIEPSRSKKGSKKNAKRILREGWIK